MPPISSARPREGWSALPERYDDGGLSGGTLERPALQRLLADIAAGRIDIIVVYKVDRLTRSLLDFAKLVEAFDKAGASFVSITQSFNTTTSMGRLTLNMLLSFAQFEREVTAERIRDKIAASKAKGMWMGGTPPLGYRARWAQPRDRRGACRASSATSSRATWSSATCGCSRPTLTRERDQCRRSRTTGSGKPLGGGRFSRGQLYVMLKRVTYVGQIAHGDKVYRRQPPGDHRPDMFDRVQAMLAEHAQGERTRPASTSPSLLAGRIVDAAGEPLIATHASEGSDPLPLLRQPQPAPEGGDTGLRIPAREIEALVADPRGRSCSTIRSS